MLDGLTIRVAEPGDIPALNRIIEESARELSVGFYTPAQIDSAIRWVFGVDSALVADRSYFVAESDGKVAGCGGWSRRRTLYGGDQRPVGAAEFLDPASDAARVRAFFVSPHFARRGVGTALLDACADAAWHAGFRKLELMATLPGVPLYRVRGFEAQEEVSDKLPDGTALSFVRMTRPLTSAPSGRVHVASVADAESIAQLHIASWRSTYRELLPDTYLDSLDLATRATQWRDSFADRSVTVVLREVIGVGLVAFCAVGRGRDEDASSPTMEIWNLHVAPGSRGNGYGAELFQEATRIARESGADELTLWVVEENDGARRFYENHGMHEDGARQVHTLAPGVGLREVRYRMKLTNVDMATQASPSQGEK